MRRWERKRRIEKETRETARKAHLQLEVDFEVLPLVDW